MKQRFYLSRVIFIILLGVLVFAGCKKDDDDNNNPTGPDTSSWPSDLPKFEYGKLFSIHNDEDTGKFSAAIFSNITNPETAYKNYKTALSSMGWVLDEDTSNDLSWAAHYDKGETSMNFTIVKDGSAAQIFYLPG